jgi:glycine dehydrogenase
MKAGINVRRIDGGVSVAFDECVSESTIEKLCKIWALHRDVASTFGAIPILRTTSYLQHPIFNSYHSETAM